MKKGINKQVFTLIALAAVLALVAVYFLGYKKYMDMATQLQDSNEALAVEVEDLKVYYLNEAQYKAEMVPMSEEIHEIMEKYPADTWEEDVIMHAVKTELAAELDYSNISIGERTTLQKVSEKVVKATAQEDMQSEIAFVERKGTYANEMDYSNLKKSIQAIFDSEYNLGIKSINYSRTGDDTPLLSGTTEIAFYSMVGNGKEYQLPNMMPYLSGSSNIFGVLYYALDEEGNIQFGENAEKVVEDLMNNAENAENTN